MRKFSSLFVLATCLFTSTALMGEEGPHYGYVEPLHGKIQVSAKESRMVTEVLVKEGDEVEAGQVLARLESSREQIEHDIVAAKLQVVYSELAIAEDALKRHEELFLQEIISEHQLTQTRLKRNTAQAKYNVAAKELELADYKLQNFEVRAPASSGYKERPYSPEEDQGE